jgi:hypothetical protein
MNESPPASAVPAHTVVVEKSPAAPLFVWLVLQLIALSLAVFRVPLSARFPPPGEQFAIHIMLVTQVTASALLFPFLLRDVKTTAMVILSIAPFLQLSSYLSSVPIPRAAMAAAYVATWLLALAMWRAILVSRRSQFVGVACATALTLGGAVIWYVAAEARDPRAIAPSPARFGPIVSALAQLRETHAGSWIPPLAMLLVSGVALYVARNRPVGGNGSSSAAR